MTDPKRGQPAAERRLCEEMQLLFTNEIVDERLEGVEITGVELSRDRRSLRLLYLPKARDRGDAEAELAGAFDDVRGLVADRAFDVLHRSRPEVRFVLDRGMRNERRVGEILAELYPDDGDADAR